MREDTIQENNGADGGGRTHTLSRVPDFESGASANSATSATNKINVLRGFSTFLFAIVPRNFNHALLPG